MIRRFIDQKSRLATIALAIAVVTAAACGDFTGVPASLPTATDSGTVYALNGAPLGAPTALHVYSGTLIPATADFVFDVAFELDSTAGEIVVLPQRTIASGLATTHAVGLAVVADTFDAVGRVPSGISFRQDTAMVLKRGQTMLVQVTDQSICGFSLTGSTMYAKLAVKSIDRPSRTMSIQYATDPNCGFRSFASGIPKD